MGRSAIQERDFEIFWNEYPRKRAKIDAQRAWRALKPSENDTFAILLGIQRYQRSGEWKNAQFIPYPATFLRRRQWEDDFVGNEIKIAETPQPRYCAICGRTGSWHLNAAKRGQVDHDFSEAA